MFEHHSIKLLPYNVYASLPPNNPIVHLKLPSTLRTSPIPFDPQAYTIEDSLTYKDEVRLIHPNLYRKVSFKRDSVQ